MEGERGDGEGTRGRGGWMHGGGGLSIKIERK